MEALCVFDHPCPYAATSLLGLSHGEGCGGTRCAYEWGWDGSHATLNRVDEEESPTGRVGGMEVQWEKPPESWGSW